MKQTLLTILLAALPWLAAMADDGYGYLTFEAANGQQQSLSVTNLSMTISGGKLVCTDGSATTELSLESLAKMFFSAEPTGIVATEATKDQTVQVYTLSGISVGCFASIDKARRQLRHGVYIIKKGEKTLKFAVE